MTADNENPGAPDLGLGALVALLRFHGVGADPEQIRHRFGAKAIGVPEMLRCAKEMGIKARAVSRKPAGRGIGNALPVTQATSGQMDGPVGLALVAPTR